MSFMFTLLRTWFCFWKGGGCVTVIACFVVYSTSPHILIEFGIGDQDNSYKTILRLYLFRDDSFHLSSRYNLFLLLVEALQDRAACKEVQHFMSMSRLHYKRWEHCLKGSKGFFFESSQHGLELSPVSMVESRMLAVFDGRKIWCRWLLRCLGSFLKSHMDVRTFIENIIYSYIFIYW